MISHTNRLGRPLPRLLAVLIVCLAPAVLTAETVIFRNDIRGAAVTVQSVSVVKGVLKRDQYSLRYKEATPKINLDYDKVITVVDPRTGRTLFKDVLRAGKKELAYSIALDRTGKVRLVATAVPPAMIKKP